jgi:hypothetical protein
MTPVIDFLKQPGLNMLEPGMTVVGGSGVREVKKNSRAYRGIEAHLAGLFFFHNNRHNLTKNGLKISNFIFLSVFPNSQDPCL